MTASKSNSRTIRQGTASPIRPTMHVLAAGFSAVKGTRHLAQEVVELDAAGAVGDRTLCLVDVARRRVLRTVQSPTLIATVARREGDVLAVELPDGAAVTAVTEPTAETVVCDYWGRAATLELLEGPHAELFSSWLGAPVRLAAAPPRAVVFGAGVTLVARSSLDDLTERLGAVVDPARFRATLVVDAGEAPYAEEGWLGREVRVGDAVLRLGGPIPRCAVVDLDPARAERHLPVLRTLASYRPRNRAGEPCFGVYAEVVTPGRVRRG